jgi:hypothetical protein
MNTRQAKSQPKASRSRKRSGKRELQDALLGLAADFIAIVSARLGVGFQPGKIPPPMHTCKACGAKVWVPAVGLLPYFCPVCGARQLGTHYKITPDNHERMTRDQAAIFVASASGMPKDYILDSAERRAHAFRVAAKRLHPDKPGGSHAEFCKLQEAMEVLG